MNMLVVALPAVAALLVYAPSLGNGFVHDDLLQIVDNPWVTQLRNLPEAMLRPVWRFRTLEPTNYFRPLQMAAYNLLWALGGGAPLVFHLASAAVHAATTALLALFLVRRGQGRGLAAAAALLFAVHPASTEAVAWVACLPELGYAFFTLAALHLHTGAWERPAAGRFRRRLLAAAAAFAAMLWKETGIVAVPLIFVAEITLAPPPATSGRPAAARLKAALGATLPALAAAVISLALRAMVLGGLAPRARAGLSLADSILNAPALLFGYLKLMLLPIDLLAWHPFHPLPGPLHTAFLLGAPALIAAGVGACFLARRVPALGLAAALTTFPLLPVLHVPALGLNVFAERYVYLPLAGMAWFLCGVVAYLGGRPLSASRTRLAAAGVGILALALAGMTVARARIWKDDETFARSVLAKEPGIGLMHAILGNHLERQGHSAAALAAYEAGIDVNPSDALLLANRANLRLTLGQITPEQAILEYGDLAALNPGSYELQAIVGDAYLAARRLEEAEAHFRRALTANPRDPMLYNRLAVTLAEAGRLDEAREALRKALAIHPGFEVARRNLERLESLPPPAPR